MERKKKKRCELKLDEKKPSPLLPCFLSIIPNAVAFVNELADSLSLPLSQLCVCKLYVKIGRVGKRYYSSFSFHSIEFNKEKLSSLSASRTYVAKPHRQLEQVTDKGMIDLRKFQDQNKPG